jgi:hypothetical protein
MTRCQAGRCQVESSQISQADDLCRIDICVRGGCDLRGGDKLADPMRL